MLTLSRKEGESVIIDSIIKVTVVEIRGGKIRLGFTAPADIPIFREELQAQIVAQSTAPPHPATDKS